MALIVEDGLGVVSAASYASIATIDAYWAARTHSSFYTTWNAGTTAKKEGSAREASAFLDAVYGSYYRGVRRGYVQGLLWPRTDALDDAGYPLPDLPPELVAATCELCARAYSAALQADVDPAARVQSETVGPIEMTYFDAGSSAPAVSYGVVSKLIDPLLNGSQPGAPNAAWPWA